MSKSFEELCFQICFEEYSEVGTLVPIDDSGGGDGVEFYLKLPNGDIWGWQCKFFGRFSEGNRKEQIKHSLRKAIDTHGNSLKRWTLVSQYSLTPTEYDWFYAIGTAKIKGIPIFPDGFSVEIKHWGDSDLINYLRTYTGIHKFFFSENVLDQDWFRQKLDQVLQSSVIQSKYLESLHIKGDAEKEIAQILASPELEHYIHEHEQSLNVLKFRDEYADAVREIGKEVYRTGFEDIYDEIKALFTDDKKQIIENGLSLLHKAKQSIRNGKRQELIDALPLMNAYSADLTCFYNQLKEYREIGKSKPIHWDTEEIENDPVKKASIKECRDILFGPFFIMRNYIDSFSYLFEKFNYLNYSEVHAFGGASKGKTHLMVNIAERHINVGKPAIFLFGKDFIADLPFHEQLKGTLDIPSTWSFDDFLSALNVAGRIADTKSLLIIDGLNEAIHWKTIWKGIERFGNEIRQKYPYVLPILSYRSSYREQLFPEHYTEHPDIERRCEIEISGFVHQNLTEAIVRYLEHYNIKLNSHSQALLQFTEPLYLKIFCQTKSGQTVSFHQEDLFDVLDEFIVKTNANIISNLGRDIRFFKNFLQERLESIAASMWEGNSREIALSEVVPHLLTPDEFFIVEAEDLLIFREFHNTEVITFVYDLLSGYQIAKELLKSVTSKETLIAFYNSEVFKIKLLDWETRHPLFEDITRSLNILSIKRFGISFSQEIESEQSKNQIMQCLFEVNESIISKDTGLIKNIVADQFNIPAQRKKIFKLFTNTEFNPQHPLNITFLSELLLNLKVSDRDLSWTEYTRESYSLSRSGNLYQLLSKFADNIRKSDIVTAKNHLQAKKILWCLTSTNRTLRDVATKALYHYGKKAPLNFLDLTLYSLQINDPYVWERSLGVLYGVLLALKAENDPQYIAFSENAAKKLYESVFSPDAIYSTTHILARDFASRTIHVAMMGRDDLLSDTEKQHTVPPYRIGGIRKYGEFKYEKLDRKTHDPIQMDFSNYTLGYIIKDGHSYSDPPAKKKARRQIYWRIFNFGWNAEEFASVDDHITVQNYRTSDERAKVERYGKKYSWIAYYEIAGLLEDAGKLENRWNDFRRIDSDIDITFPEKTLKKKIIKENLLGDPQQKLIDWYKRKDPIILSDYYSIDNLKDFPGEWVCMDGYCTQKDRKLERSTFIFIRALLVKNEEHSTFIRLLEKQYVGGRWLPEIIQNETVFAGELFILPGAAASNETTISFVTKSKEVEINPGDPEYEWQSIFEQIGFPTEKKRKQMRVERQTEDFNVLLPVMDYYSGQKNLDVSGTQTTLSREIAEAMNLMGTSEHLNTYDATGKIASLNFHHTAKKERQRFSYLRKDILDNYLIHSGYKLVYCAWGERELHFNDSTFLRTFRKSNNIDGFQVFKHISTYKK